MLGGCTCGCLGRLQRPIGCTCGCLFERRSARCDTSEYSSALRLQEQPPDVLRYGCVLKDSMIDLASLLNQASILNHVTALSVPAVL